MKYCVTCGAAIEFDDASFCPYCGRKIQTASEIVEKDTMESLWNGISTEDVLDAESVVVEPEDIDEGYRVVLISRGSCTLKMAKEVICDLLGYASATVTDLLAEMPVELADELNERQAVVLAQALAEYGMEVTVVDENNRYVNISKKATDTVYSAGGELKAAALAVIASLTAANRVHRYRRYKKPSLLDLIFRPAYKVKQPVHVRRSVVKEPESLRRIAVKKTRISTGIPPKKAAVRPAPAVRKEQPAKPKGSSRPQGGAKPQGNVRPQSGNRPQGSSGPQGGNKPQGNVRPQSGNRPQGSSGPQGGNKPQGSGHGTSHGGNKPQGGGHGTSHGGRR